MVSSGRDVQITWWFNIPKFKKMVEQYVDLHFLNILYAKENSLSFNIYKTKNIQRLYIFTCIAIVIFYF